MCTLLPPSPQKRIRNICWFLPCELHLSQENIMILDHISIAAIRLLKFTNKGSTWVHAASRKFCKCWKERLTQLTSELYFHFVEIKRQNKRKETVKYSGTKYYSVVFSCAQGARFIGWKILLRFCRILAYWSKRNTIQLCYYLSPLLLLFPHLKAHSFFQN